MHAQACKVQTFAPTRHVHIEQAHIGKSVLSAFKQLVNQESVVTCLAQQGEQRYVQSQVACHIGSCNQWCLTAVTGTVWRDASEALEPCCI